MMHIRVAWQEVECNKAIRVIKIWTLLAILLQTGSRGLALLRAYTCADAIFLHLQF